MAPAISLFQRLLNETFYGCSDFYTASVFGANEVGTSTVTCHVFHPPPRKFTASPYSGYCSSDDTSYDLGFEVLQIEGRAVVNQVEPDSFAYSSGVRPLDVIQLALIIDDRFDGDDRQKDRAKLITLKRENLGVRTSYDDFVMLSSGPKSSKVYPIAIAFKRTRKRDKPGGSGMGVINFKLEEEVEKAAIMINSLLSESVATDVESDLFDEIVYAAANVCSGNDKPNENAYNNNDPDHSPNPNLTHLNQLINSTKVSYETQLLNDLIKTSKGLCFLRVAKLATGVSVSSGTGCVIARLSDNTWSAPSAVGIGELGCGLQVGVTVTDMILFIKNEETLKCFYGVNSFRITLSVGFACAVIGRDLAAGFSVNALSVSANGLNRDNLSESVSTIVAFGKCKGLYVGLVLNGAVIFPRHFVNDCYYKVMAGRRVTSEELLTGEFQPPSTCPSLKSLYDSLTRCELTLKFADLPAIPSYLNSPSDRVYSSSTPSHLSLTYSTMNSTSNIYSLFATTSNKPKFHSKLRQATTALFETSVRDWLMSSVTCRRHLPRDSTRSSSTSGGVRREVRRFGLVLPFVGSMILGFVERVNRGNGLDAGNGNNSTGGQSRNNNNNNNDQSSVNTGIVDFEAGRLRLDDTLSVELTSITSVRGLPHDTQTTTSTTIDYDPNDLTEEGKLVVIESFDKPPIMIFMNTVEEAVLMAVGLKVIIESETERCGVRGGVVINHRNGDNDGDGDDGDDEGFVKGDRKNSISNSSFRVFADDSDAPRTLTMSMPTADGKEKCESKMSINSSDFVMLGSALNMRELTNPSASASASSPDILTHRNTLAFSRGAIQPPSSTVLGKLAISNINSDILRQLLLDAQSPFMIKWLGCRKVTEVSAWNRGNSSGRHGDSSDDDDGGEDDTLTVVSSSSGGTSDVDEDTHSKLSHEHESGLLSNNKSLEIHWRTLSIKNAGYEKHTVLTDTSASTFTSTSTSTLTSHQSRRLKIKAELEMFNCSTCTLIDVEETGVGRCKVSVVSNVTPHSNSSNNSNNNSNSSSNNEKKGIPSIVTIERNIAKSNQCLKGIYGFKSGGMLFELQRTFERSMSVSTRSNMSMSMSTSSGRSGGGEKGRDTVSRKGKKEMRSADKVTRTGTGTGTGTAISEGGLTCFSTLLPASGGRSYDEEEEREKGEKEREL